MCPACMASAGVIGSVVSTGGVTAVLAKILRKKNDDRNPKRKEK